MMSRHRNPRKINESYVDQNGTTASEAVSRDNQNPGKQNAIVGYSYNIP